MQLTSVDLKTKRRKSRDSKSLRCYLSYNNQAMGEILIGSHTIKWCKGLGNGGKVNEENTNFTYFKWS